MLISLRESLDSLIAQMAVVSSLLKTCLSKRPHLLEAE